jgi:hypothetical protein
MQYHSNIDIWWVFQFIDWVYTIVNHCLVSMAVQLPSYLFRTGYEGNCMVCRPNWYKNKLPSNIHILLVSKNVKSSL